MAPSAWVRVRVGAAILLSVFLTVGGLQATVQPSAALSICATENCATLSVTIRGDGGGTVTSDDGNIACSYVSQAASGTCGERVIWAIGKPNPTVTVTAMPAAGSIACSGPIVPDCSSEGAPTSQSFQLPPGDVHVAVFTFNNSTRTVTASVSGNGKGTILAYSAQIICPATCSSVLPYGWVGTFTATPSAGSAFKAWTGACAGQRATCQLTLTANATIDAEFDVPVVATPTATPNAKPGATPRSTIAGGSPPPGTSAPTDFDVAASPGPSQQVQGATATPAPSIAPPADQTNQSGSGSIPWLPILVLVAVMAVAVNALAFQVLRARRPPR